MPAATPIVAPVADQIPPAAVVPVVAATPRPQRRCPEGVFYLVRKVSVSSDTGVMSAHPGTKVTFVREENGKIIVNNGEMDIPVMQDHLTNDLDEVDAILEAEAVGAIARKKALDSKKAATAGQVPSTSLPSDNAISDVSLGETFSSPPPISDAPDLRGRRELAKMQALQTEIATLGMRIEADLRELQAIEDEEADRQWQRRHWGRASQSGVGIRQSKFEVQKRVDALQRQQSALMIQMKILTQ